MKGILMERRHVEANFRIYFKVGVNLKILHFNQSSIEFGECIGTMVRRSAGRDTEVKNDLGNANNIGVGLNDIEDDDLWFDEIDRLIDESNSRKYNTSSDLNDSFDEYDGESDHSEDNKLFVARENMRKVVVEKSDLRSLSEIVKEIDNVESKKKKLKEKCGEDLTQHMDVDVDSGDSYDTDSEDEICRRRKRKLKSLTNQTV
ncbi:hypothetical protein ACFE04_022133 [Oxalis oulophora]